MISKTPDRRIYQAQFRHTTCDVITPGIEGVSPDQLPSYEPGTEEGRLQALAALRNDAAIAHQENCPTHQEVLVVGLALFRYILNGLEASPEEVVAAEKEYRDALKAFANY